MNKRLLLAGEVLVATAALSSCTNNTPQGSPLPSQTEIISVPIAPAQICHDERPVAMQPGLPFDIEGEPQTRRVGDVAGYAILKSQGATSVVDIEIGTITAMAREANGATHTTISIDSGAADIESVDDRLSHPYVTPPQFSHQSSATLKFGLSSDGALTVAEHFCAPAR